MNGLFDKEALEAYLDMLFGREQGYVATARGANPYRSSVGKYCHREWTEHTWAWPDDRPKLLSEVGQDLAAGELADWYVCPTLRGGRSRKAGDPDVRGRYAWADLDGAAVPDWAGSLGAAVIESGTAGHFHLYIPLGEWLPGDELAAINRALAQAIGDGADAKWQHNSLLRLAGTANFKATVTTS
jgi:putative DNA primase/helicase